MRIIHVNHGYPPRYNAGSEVYCRNLARTQAPRHEVSVFSREEDPYRPDYVLRTELDGSIPVRLANMPRTQHRYQHDALDAAFEGVVRQERPDVVHFHHLNHLSLGLPAVAARAGTAVVFTIHDFWLACPRGQFIQWSVGSGEPWALCEGQENHRCARACFARAWSGTPPRSAADEAHWADWVGDRMAAVSAMLEAVDAFICPSRTVVNALRARFPQVGERVFQRDYGFPELPAVERLPGPFTFGYLGTHTPAKGIDLLIRAFREVPGPVRLSIWGRHRGQETEALQRLASGDRRVSFEGEYRNEDLRGVLSRLDAVVVPSIWLENSPLVIHEAQQARVCVVTADAGGMAEYVAHGENGLLFRHRDERDLARQLCRLAAEPGLAGRLGRRGYLHTSDGAVPAIAEHAAWLEGVYARARGGAHAA